MVSDSSAEARYSLQQSNGNSTEETLTAFFIAELKMPMLPKPPKCLHLTTKDTSVRVAACGCACTRTTSRSQLPWALHGASTTLRSARSGPEGSSILLVVARLPHGGLLVL